MKKTIREIIEWTSKSKVLLLFSRTFKILVFFTFLWTSSMMFKVRNETTGILILLTISLFLALNKIDNMERRLNRMEGK